ncbi:hypothetical protein AWM75_01255 [Aerococcus urinaehominis]|uniref:Uncharacterized protein n=1 Tax=Aerococcus urinaehominis TaxID=128944 RepID=A0A0X8FKF4_9LACT|nr:DUF4767 domain-containing protein [Aerococcus urinaehominis]AMB98704.1 hypothetical protein AWM75_01255 [Aerococcus urinaehominis]SDL99323.1 protein of unknown function [Aerococcus urinaehominis]
MKEKLCLLLALVSLAGCQKQTDHGANESEAAKPSSSAQTVKPAKGASQSHSVMQSESESQIGDNNQMTSGQINQEQSTNQDQNPVYWSAEKDIQLADFMASWGAEMGQSYLAYSPDNPVSFYGPLVPDALIAENSHIRPVLNDQLVNMSWYQVGRSADNYQIVAVYSDIETSNEPAAHLYLFVIHQGEPLVLYSGQNQGNEHNYFYFTITDNQALQDGFASIVNQ